MDQEHETVPGERDRVEFDAFVGGQGQLVRARRPGHEDQVGLLLDQVHPGAVGAGVLDQDVVDDAGESLAAGALLVGQDAASGQVLEEPAARRRRVVRYEQAAGLRRGERPMLLAVARRRAPDVGTAEHLAGDHALEGDRGGRAVGGGIGQHVQRGGRRQGFLRRSVGPERRHASIQGLPPEGVGEGAACTSVLPLLRQALIEQVLEVRFVDRRHPFLEGGPRLARLEGADLVGGDQLVEERLLSRVGSQWPCAQGGEEDQEGKEDEQRSSHADHGHLLQPGTVAGVGHRRPLAASIPIPLGNGSRDHRTPPASLDIPGATSPSGHYALWT